MVWWDVPKGLTSHQFRGVILHKNTETIAKLINNTGGFGLKEDDTNTLVANDGPAAKKAAEDEAVDRVLQTKPSPVGDFTPLVEPYRSLGGVTVFDEVLLRNAIGARVPLSLQSIENLRPHDTQKFRHLERFLPLMNKEMRELFVTAKDDKESEAHFQRPNFEVKLYPVEDVVSATDGGYVSWRVFMKELQECAHKITRGRHLFEFVDQSDQYLEMELAKLRLKNVVAPMYDSPFLGSAEQIVYSTTKLKQQLNALEPEKKYCERKNFLAFLRWIDALLTSISNVRLREIISWRPLTYKRVADIRHNFDSRKLARGPSVMFHTKWRTPKNADGEVNGEPVTEHIGGANSKMNLTDQTQVDWRKFHRDKMAGKFDRPRPLGGDIGEWRYSSGLPPWMEVISKVQNRFQAVKSELSLQTIIRKTQKRVNENNAADLINAVHEKWKKAERAKRVKYEKFLRRKKEEVYWTLRHPNWEERAQRRKSETLQDRFRGHKEKFRVNTWYPDLKDQCKVIMGTVRPMKMIEKFSCVLWDHFNFALERLALVLCSTSTADLTAFQFQAAARFILREIFGGPEDLIHRCCEFRNMRHDQPFLRPGRGDSLTTQAEPILLEIAEKRSAMNNRLKNPHAQLFESKHNRGMDNDDGPVLRRPVIDLSGSLRPINLPVRAVNPVLPKASDLFYNQRSRRRQGY